MTLPDNAETITRTLMVPIDVTFDVGAPAIVELLTLEPNLQGEVVAVAACRQLHRLFGLANSCSSIARFSLHEHTPGPDEPVPFVPADDPTT